MQADGALLELLFSLQAISGTSTATDSLMNYHLAWLDLLCHLATFYDIWGTFYDIWVTFMKLVQLY